MVRPTVHPMIRTGDFDPDELAFERPVHSVEVD
jgi:hypothetical protein